MGLSLLFFFLLSVAALVELKVSPTVVPEPSGTVVVTWKLSGADAPSRADDFISMSCGATLGPTDFLESVTLPAGLTNGTVDSFDELYSMRCEWRFSFVRNGWNLASATATMELPDSYPRQIRLLPHNRTMIVVAWTSSSATPGSVSYGAVGGSWTSALSHSAVSTYSNSSMCSPPATMWGQQLFRDPGFFHQVTVGPLEPDTVYEYSVIQENWTLPLVQFRSPPAPGADSVAFLAHGDMGSWLGDGDPRTVVARELNDVFVGGKYSFLLHFGDVSYAHSKAYMWDAFGIMLSPLSSRIVTAMTVGNHEYDYFLVGNASSCAQDPSGADVPFHPSWGNFGSDGGGEAGVPLSARFNGWGKEQNGNGVFWWSTEMGPVKLVAFSAEHDFLEGSRQWKWIQEELRTRTNRSRTPFLVVTTHRQFYTRELDDGGVDPMGDIVVAKFLRLSLETLFLESKVNLVLAGHQHTYMRTCAVAYGRCRSEGIYYVVAGTAGAGCGPPCPPRVPVSPGEDDWTEMYINDAFGHLRFHASRQRLAMQFVESTTGTILDELSISL